VWLCAYHHSSAVPLVKSGGVGSDKNINFQVHQSSFATNSLTVTSDECVAQSADKLSAREGELSTETGWKRVSLREKGKEQGVTMSHYGGRCGYFSKIKRLSRKKQFDLGWRHLIFFWPRALSVSIIASVLYCTAPYASAPLSPPPPALAPARSRLLLPWTSCWWYVKLASELFGTLTGDFGQAYSWSEYFQSHIINLLEEICIDMSM